VRHAFAVGGEYRCVDRQAVPELRAVLAVAAQFDGGRFLVVDGLTHGGDPLRVGVFAL
jgi:hypothetical protein